MSITTGYAGVLDIEAEWLTADLSAEGLPPLSASRGGPFHAIGAEVRRLDQARHQLWLVHTRSTQGRGSKSDTRLVHEVTAVILWHAAGAGHRAHVDQAKLAEAVEAVLLRVGHDLTHGGRWWGVGPATVNPPTPLQLLAWRDALAAAGAAHELTVTWTATEWR